MCLGRAELKKKSVRASRQAVASPLCLDRPSGLPDRRGERRASCTCMASWHTRSTSGTLDATRAPEGCVERDSDTVCVRRAELYQCCQQWKGGAARTEPCCAHHAHCLEIGQRQARVERSASTGALPLLPLPLTNSYVALQDAPQNTAVMRLGRLVYLQGYSTRKQSQAPECGAHHLLQREDTAAEDFWCCSLLAAATVCRMHSLYHLVTKRDASP